MVLEGYRSASTFPSAIEATQLGIMSANLTVNHPNISVWVIHGQNEIIWVQWNWKMRWYWQASLVPHETEPTKEPMDDLSFFHLSWHIWQENCAHILCSQCQSLPNYLVIIWKGAHKIIRFAVWGPLHSEKKGTKTVPPPTWPIWGISQDIPYLFKGALFSP